MGAINAVVQTRDASQRSKKDDYGTKSEKDEAQCRTKAQRTDADAVEEKSARWIREREGSA
ncbi:hypothetical protein AA0311_2235 [Asaia bogorensis NBRC 16594]|uniref:Uncharacterized protein n=1 Tax=Asaia bogorensis NBRC 16594 TaxID=1231624 RepID=A0AAN4U1G8_9PROT|nr:hypothetical protein AA0311_2235 [Asaia bogorensis NBRC 16594]GEL52362.1 hypothetical protein ABO01nite_03690 [Asaia bogorensis NBRC 16594]